MKSFLGNLWLVLLVLVFAGCHQAPHVQSAERDCPVVAGVKAAYVGPYRGIENVIQAADLARDVLCAEAFKSSKYPRGFVTVFGSSRIRENNDACVAGICNEALKARQDAIYAAVRRFASDWTGRFGRQLPILSGAGPGLMEAAHRGAAEAGGPSIGYTTYYDRVPNPTPDRPYGGDATKALNVYVSDGLIFTSVAAREAAMIRHAAAIVIAPGGTGTEWEIFQTAEMIKSVQLRRIPVYFLGDALSWQSSKDRINNLVAQRAVSPNDLSFLRYVSTPEELLAALAADLQL